MIDIVVPLHHGGGSLGDDSELRFVLRAIETNFQGRFRVTVIGKKLPVWMDAEQVTHIATGNGLKTALKLASETHPEGFFWWYDDVILLKSESADQLKVTAARAKFQHTKTSWGRSLTKIHDRLKKEGFEPRDYSHPHGVYWFDKSMVDEGFSDWPGMAGKFPWESWILSKRAWPWRAGVVKQFYGDKFNPDGVKEHTFLNFNGKGFSPKLIAWLHERFPSRSRFEKVADPALKLEVHTIRFGESEWLKLCSATMDTWAARHGHEVKIWSYEDIDPTYPHPKFVEVDMLREFLDGSSDWMLYVDADIYVAATAPAHPNLDQCSGIVIRRDLSARTFHKFPEWVAKHFSAKASVVEGFTYLNAGVWAIDRDGAKRMLEVISKPYFEGVMEQHHWNWWIANAKQKGLRITELSREWNQWPTETQPGYFYHILGKDKERKLARFRRNGLIPPKMGDVPEIDLTDVQVVLSRYSEDVAWANGLKPKVYDKGFSPNPGSVSLPNTGFEAHTWLHHFAENYDNLKPITVCFQAHPFDHINEDVYGLYNFVKSLRKDTLSFCPIARRGFWMTSDGRSKGWSLEKCGVPLERVREVWRGVLGYPPPGLFHFWQGAQFAVSRAQVHRRPREFYANAAKVVQTKSDALVLETMWGHIFS